MTTIVALIERDLLVLRRNLVVVALRILVQPVLFVFVFTVVFPLTGQSIGGSQAARFATLLVPGTVALVTVLQGIQAVALPMVADLGYTREVEARAMAPVAPTTLALVRVGTGAIECLVGGLLVAPLAYFIPPHTPNLHISPVGLAVVAVLGALVGSTLGLTLGTVVRPDQVPMMFSLVVVPITFLGGSYYPWAALGDARWLQVLVLANPVVFVNEAFRAVTTPQIDAMPLAVSVTAMVAVILALGATGTRRFARLLVR